MALWSLIVTVITLDIFPGCTKRQRDNPQFRNKRIPFPIHITKTGPYILAAAYHETSNSMYDRDALASISIVQTSLIPKLPHDQRRWVQRQNRAVQHNGIVQGIVSRPWRSKMECSHAGRHTPLQPVHDGVKLCIGKDLGITIPDTFNAVLKNVIDHQDLLDADLSGGPSVTAR